MYFKRLKLVVTVMQGWRNLKIVYLSTDNRLKKTLVRTNALLVRT